MAEIIPFGRKQPKQPEAAAPEQPAKASWVSLVESAPGTSEAQVRLATDMQYLLANMLRVNQTRDRIVEIDEYIQSLAGFSKSDGNVQIRREGLASASLENLCHIVLSSSRVHWQSKPNYYGAVLLEYNARIKKIMALVPK